MAAAAAAMRIIPQVTKEHVCTVKMAGKVHLHVNTCIACIYRQLLMHHTAVPSLMSSICCPLSCQA